MFILVNLKAYPYDPIEVATAARGVAEASGVCIAVFPQVADIFHVADTGVGTWAQHVDPNGHGSYAGSTFAKAVTEAGTVGTLINHSERRLKLINIDDPVQATERAGLETYVCANNPAQIGAISAPGPGSVAVEPPELVGGDVSVATVDPDIVTDAIGAAVNVNEDVGVYYGAGISVGDNMMTVEEFGASNILLASGVAKANDPRATLRDPVSGL